MKSLLSLWAPVAACMAAIFFVSAQTDPPVPAATDDKLLHALAYGGLALLVCRALAGGLPARITARIAMWAIAITVGYGATDELHQLFVPGRSAEWLDLLADFAGAAAALIACWAWGILDIPKPRMTHPGSPR